MKKVEIIIPKQDNDGSDNSALIEKTIRQMCELYGGATVYEAKGYWISDSGQLYVDENRVIVAATTEAESSDTIRDIAREVLDLTDQEAIFISDGTKSEIIE